MQGRGKGGKGKGGKKRKGKKKKRGGQNGGQTPAPLPEGCCGAKSCADPEPGSTRSECDFAGRSFVGEDHNGSTMRGIDGRGARFTATDHHGSIFADACLQGASFRRARLDDATWGDACLFEADFTGADLGDDTTLFAGARFCATIMPDGRVNNRDCDQATDCCRLSAEPGPACQNAGDCADEACQTKACQNGTCVYSEVADGTDPSGQCTHCCEGECCQPPANQCNPAGLCCAPNCAGRDCGPDGCGAGGTCGECPAGVNCNAQSGQCGAPCRPGTCPNGCCDAHAVCQPGNTSQACGTFGRACAACSGPERCLDGQCCAPDCQGKSCGPDGCGGFCGACAAGQRCTATGQCLCDRLSCPDGCCDADETCQPGDSAQACGNDGGHCATCGQSEVCDEASRQCISQCSPPCQPGQWCDGVRNQCICDGSSCPGCCDPVSETCQPGTGIGACGVGGAVCQDCILRGHCVNGNCQCDADFCPHGCCEFGPGQPGLCFEDDPRFCGTGGEQCKVPNGGACTVDSECCSANCFNNICADLVTHCEGNPCNPPAHGCAGSTCCEGTTRKSCGDICCPAAFVCCGTRCCGPNQRCCSHNGVDFCCPPPFDCCGEQCCGGDGEFQCCPGENCCPIDYHCCPGACCPNPCCGSECCPPGWTCCRDAGCCPPDQQCCTESNPNGCC